ncbi:cobyric acid synthase CobQ [Desulfurispirillum indicum S5]|uniref:Cobyric acid synthase n=2 Tax=Desulfurispirillum TaxID=393029 RepID=E6W0S1_DESIS|nr:cobyric acid synthase [Desulfurispirillum indicum]ADU66416.1 cobyric acid synthase CobQ [Desulfurispirillum indicum S5]
MQDTVNPRKVPSIMFQGTGSGVGKSLITAGFCRLLRQRGLRVAPFKSQNMALNAGVTAHGLEMGRAQILQAEAAGIAPDVRMNPILLKPQGQSCSQLVRMGKVAGTCSAREYYTLSRENLAIATAAYDSLCTEYDIIVLEGAGSPAEINLQGTDIVNMRMARHAGARVFVVGDIDRGGVFAWLKGTYDLVPADARPLIHGFLINKFRGDVSLLQPGIEMFADLVPVPVHGVLPWLRLSLEEEDSQDLASDRGKAGATVHVGVVRLPHISNFSDFAPLKAMEEVRLSYLEQPSQLAECDLVIVPGSKHSLHDLEFLRRSGFAAALQEYVGTVPIMGICGGLQMLGQHLEDPQGVEGLAGGAAGLGLLPLTTVMAREKTLRRGSWAGAGRWQGQALSGYEMHVGQSRIHSDVEQLCTDDLCLWDGSRRVFGTYLHGIFENAANLRLLAGLLRLPLPIVDYQSEKERQLDLLAHTIAEHCDIDAMLEGLL